MSIILYATPEELLPSAKTTSQQRRDARRVRAGKETGCLFYFIFHSACVGGDALTVRVREMDKAFKNKKGHYREGGEAVLRFATQHEQHEQPQPQPQQPGLAIVPEAAASRGTSTLGDPERV